MLQTSGAVDGAIFERIIGHTGAVPGGGAAGRQLRLERRGQSVDQQRRVRRRNGDLIW